MGLDHGLKKKEWVHKTDWRKVYVIDDWMERYTQWWANDLVLRDLENLRHYLKLVDAAAYALEVADLDNLIDAHEDGDTYRYWRAS